jgi:choline dehydrogenase-like flavoprotein
MVIIIGSGAGGAIIAMELAKANIPVTIIEKGPYIKSKDAFKYYDPSDEGVDLLKTTCIGGSTIVSAGNGVRSLEKEFKNIGIDLSKEYEQIEKILNIHQMDNEHIGQGTQKFIDSAKELGFETMKMPKFIRDSECTICGKCAFGCPQDAKWSSKDFIDIAVKNNANLLTETEVTKLIIENGKIMGVEVKKDNETKILHSNQIILSAGAINSAILLQKSGIKAGEKLFFDPFVTVGGLLKDIKYNTEVQMNALAIGNEFILAPHFSTFAASFLKENGYNITNKDILSIMVKIPDDGLGKIRNGKVIKYNSINDIKRLAEGSAAAGAILTKAGVDPTTITSTVFRGAHPGGTAAIGEVVNNNLQTEIEGLYVSDASVIPWAPGKPPILLILALSLRLAKYLIEKQE